MSQCRLNKAASAPRSRLYLDAAPREETIDETPRNSKEAMEAHLQALKDQISALEEKSLFIGRVQVEVTQIF